jgi:hypothetical protein
MLLLLATAGCACSPCWAIDSDCRIYVYDTFPIPTSGGDTAFESGASKMPSTFIHAAPKPFVMPDGRKGFNENGHAHLSYYFHKRALEDPRRVHDPANASLFFVDFSRVTDGRAIRLDYDFYSR